MFEGKEILRLGALYILLLKSLTTNKYPETNIQHMNPSVNTILFIWLFKLVGFLN